MEYLIGLLVALLGGVFYFKTKADNAAIESKLAHTKGRDKELEMTENELKAAIEEIDKNVDKIVKERAEAKVKNDNMTLAERRARIKKGQQ